MRIWLVWFNKLKNMEANKLFDVFNNNKLLNKGIEYEDMNYANNWENIMTTATKISKVIELFSLTGFEQWRISNDIAQDITKCCILSDKETIYLSCLAFLQWYYRPIV